MIHLLTPKGSVPYAQDYLDRADLGPRGDCIPYEEIPLRNPVPPGRYVFTGINRLGPAFAELMAELHDQLEGGMGYPPLNHPLRTLRRFELLQALHREGLNDFQAYGAWEDFSDARFPVFVRHREQDGGVPTLLYTEKEVERAIGNELLEGFALHDLLVIEFENTVDDDGLYRKYSAYIVGSRIVPVSIDYGWKWVLRSGQNARPKDATEEEMGFIKGNPYEDQLARIFTIAYTQFGRIDFSVKEDRVQTWEINTLPLLRRPAGRPPRSPEDQAIWAPRKKLMRVNFPAAWDLVLSSSPPGQPIPISFHEDTLRRAQTELESKGVTTQPISVLFPRLRRSLRPVKPLLKPIAARFLHPFLGRQARRDAK